MTDLPTSHTTTTDQEPAARGRVWFVTGSSRGLGRAIVEAALAHGERVVATARRPEVLADLVAAHPGQVLPIALDVTDLVAVRAAVQAATDAFGRLDVVVNNAGYANLSSIEDTDPADFRAQVDTNLFGVVNVTQAVLPALRAAGGGRIVNVSSIGARLGTPLLGAYQAAKWAVSGFTEVLAAEVAGFGIRATAIEPGGIRTDWAGSSMDVPAPSAPYAPVVDAMQGAFANGSDDSLGEPAKVAAAVLRVVDAPEPPVRLLLGSDAYAIAGALAARQAASDQAWEALSRSTDRDDPTPAHLDPLGQVG